MTVVAAYLFAGVMSMVAGGLLLSVNIIIRGWFFASMVVVTLFVLMSAYGWLERHGGQSRDRLALALTTALGFFGLTLLIEYRPLRWFLVIMATVIMFLLHLPEGYVLATPHRGKIFRRVWMMLWVFNFYALATFLFGMGNFFPSVPFWLLDLTIGCIGGLVALMIWRMYVELSLPQTVLVGTLTALMVSEVVWVLRMLPFGYLAAAFITTWVWYLLQLLFRFHFGTQDIVWRRQWKFLFVNVALFCLMLMYFIRWV